MLVAVEVNGTPQFGRISFGIFDTNGLWTVSGTVPPGLAGKLVTFQSFGIAPTGKVDVTNPEVVTFQ